VTGQRLPQRSQGARPRPLSSVDGAGPKSRDVVAVSVGQHQGIDDAGDIVGAPVLSANAIAEGQKGSPVRTPAIVSAAPAEPVSTAMARTAGMIRMPYRIAAAAKQVQQFFPQTLC
jgi:hypothetical protein